MGKLFNNTPINKIIIKSMSNEEVILLQINNLIKSVENLKMEKKELYTNKEMLELLGISTVTLKKWRNRGYIGYSQVGSTYYYSANDLKEFLERNHNEAYAYQ